MGEAEGQQRVSFKGWCSLKEGNSDIALSSPLADVDDEDSSRQCGMRYRDQDGPHAASEMQIAQSTLYS